VADMLRPGEDVNRADWARVRFFLLQRRVATAWRPLGDWDIHGRDTQYPGEDIYRLRERQPADGYEIGLLRWLTPPKKPLGPRPSNGLEQRLFGSKKGKSPKVDHGCSERPRPVLRPPHRRAPRASAPPLPAKRHRSRHKKWAPPQMCSLASLLSLGKALTMSERAGVPLRQRSRRRIMGGRG